MGKTRVVTAVLAAAAAIAAAAALGAAREGDPARGELVWTSNACGACHAFSKAGSTGSQGNAPDLDRWLVPHARRVALPIELFVFSRVYWGGRGMQGYGGTLSTQEIEDLVSFAAGKPFSAPPEGIARVPPLPVPPPLVTAGAVTVARWVRLERLPRRATRGATLFAQKGCLSCHTYLTSGKRRFGAADLGGIGRTGRSVSTFQRYVARPYLYGNTLMPSYANLGEEALRAIGAFLAASRGRQ